MYEFLYFIVYKKNEKDGILYSRLNCSIIVGLAILIHLLFLLTLTRYLLGVDVFQKLKWLSSGHLGIKVISILIFMIFTFFYFDNKRSQIVVERYKHVSYTSYKNYLLASSIIFVPLAIIIILNWKG